MHVSDRGLRLIESFEGFSSRQYDDGTGVMTIGYGTTSADVSPLPGHMTQPEAQKFLADHIRNKYEPSVNAVNPANQNQYDALVSFVYNLGPGAMAWDVGRDTKAGNYRAAADAMLAYDHAGGQRMLGLTRRRQAERALYLTPAGPPPPPPFPYDRFPTQDVSVGKGSRKVNERERVLTYDRLNAHPWRNRAQLHNVRRDLAYLAQRVAYVALVLDKHGKWSVNHRGWRYQELHKRAGGAVAAQR